MCKDLRLDMDIVEHYPKIYYVFFYLIWAFISFGLAVIFRNTTLSSSECPFYLIFPKHVPNVLQGDKLEIMVLNVDGIRCEYMELRKDWSISFLLSLLPCCRIITECLLEMHIDVVVEIILCVLTAHQSLSFSFHWIKFAPLFPA